MRTTRSSTLALISILYFTGKCTAKSRLWRLSVLCVLTCTYPQTAYELRLWRLYTWTADLPVSLFVHGTECIAEVKVMQSGMILLETLYLRIKPLWLHMAPVCLCHGPSPNCLKFDSPACLLLATVNRITLGMQQTPVWCIHEESHNPACTVFSLSLSLCVCVCLCMCVCVHVYLHACVWYCVFVHSCKVISCRYKVVRARDIQIGT